MNHPFDLLAVKCHVSFGSHETRKRLPVGMQDTLCLSIQTRTHGFPLGRGIVFAASWRLVVVAVSPPIRGAAGWPAKWLGQPGVVGIATKDPG